MKHPQFRLKVDLSKFFHDARQFCWIFIDGIKIQKIFDIQQHISKLFSITEPFHLLLNDTEYLPPTEDVRILKENETIQIIPGSGIKNEIDRIKPCNGSIHDDKQIHTANMKTGIVVSDTLEESNNTLNDTQTTSINNTTENITFYSVIDDTVINDKLDTEEDTDFKVMDNNLIEDCNITDSNASIVKKKRVRKRRPKNRCKPQIILPSNMIEENKPKKPKIIDSYIISPGKHIRFDIEKEENNIAKQIVQEVSKNESYINETSSSRDLSTLLALGQNSTPITFVNKKVKSEIKMENKINDGIKNKTLDKTVEDNISMEKNLCNKEKTQGFENWMHSNLEIIPIMTRKPQVKDIIAFKTLKIGADYTPQISNFIVTEVVDSCVQSSNYYLKIINGREEIQVPFGKFSLSNTSTSHCDADIFLLNYSQMQELRLLTSY